MSTTTAPPTAAPAPRVRLCGVAFDALSERAAIELVVAASERGAGGWIVNPNLDGLRQWVGDAAVAELCGAATLVLADGMPLIWASRLQRTPLPERVAGSNLIFSLSAAAARSGRSLFLLGGDPGTAEETARILRQRDPGLLVAGTHCPPHGFERDALELRRIRDLLVAARPDIVYVALGLPKQERLIHALREQLPNAWWLGLGISFSFVCGRVKRAPRWMQRCGLEWLHRLIQEPGRLGKRYLLLGAPFAVRLFASALRQAFRSMGSRSSLSSAESGRGRV
jgi:N-acetylglucosaminyldiphosphoundecaprenol N-acetyl-beta-D-mannosaminyltransferase